MLDKVEIDMAQEATCKADCLPACLSLTFGSILLPTDARTNRCTSDILTKASGVLFRVFAPDLNLAGHTAHFVCHAALAKVVHIQKNNHFRSGDTNSDPESDIGV